MRLERRSELASVDEGATGEIVGERHACLRDMVAKEIREAILTGRFQPGERLAELRLARDFRVSRNPVREALRELEADGLIEISPRRGAAVSVIPREEAEEVVELRAILESWTARVAARRRDPATIAALERVVALTEEAMAAQNHDELGPLNARFHDLIAEAGRNRILGDLVRSLRERTRTTIPRTDIDRPKRIWDEHAEILAAIKAGDEEQAASRALRHTRRTGMNWLQSGSIVDR
jgi:DNA-binding GntR family transcriptional regulator